MFTLWFLPGSLPYLRPHQETHHQCKGKDDFHQGGDEGKLPVTEEVAKAFLRCTTCMNCTTNCPSGAHPQKVIKAARKQMVDAGHDNLFKAMGKVVDKFGNIYGESGRH